MSLYIRRMSFAQLPFEYCREFPQAKTQVHIMQPAIVSVDAIAPDVKAWKMLMVPNADIMPELDDDETSSPPPRRPPLLAAAASLGGVDCKATIANSMASATQNS